MTLLQITLSMTVMIVLLLLFEKIIGNKFSAKCRYILWAMVIIRLAVPLNIPVYTVEAPNRFADQPKENAVVFATNASVPVTAMPEPEETSVMIPSAIPEHNTQMPETEPLNSPPVEAEASDKLPSLKEWLKTIETILSSVYVKVFWLTGAMFFAAYKLTVHGIYTAKLKRNKRLASDEIYEIYRALTEKYRIKHPPALYRNDSVASPMLYGFFKPSILLPSCVEDSNAAVVILSHELTHYRRRDLWMKLVCLIAVSFHWFNPFVHLASRKCTQAMELSCDEAVLKGLNEEVRRGYGNIMLDIVKRCRNNGEALTTHFNPRKNAVTERFLNILDTRKKRRGILLIGLVLLLCVAGCTVSVNHTDEQAAGELQKELVKTDSTTSGETESAPVESTETIRSEEENDRIAGLNKAYRLCLDEEISTETLIADNKDIRENMAEKVNEIIQAFKDGKNPMELLPNPPTLTKPTYTRDFNEADYVTADEILSLLRNSGGKTEENGNCSYKFTIPLDGGIYPNEFMDLYWSIGQFGESCEMYINHIEIYTVQERLNQKAASLPIQNLHYQIRLPGSTTWLCAGRSEEGSLLLCYTPNNGDSFYPIDAEIPDKTYDTASLVTMLNVSESGSFQLLVELMKKGMPEYVFLNGSFTPDRPLCTCTYSGAVSYEELLNITAMYPNSSIRFPNQNVPDSIQTADSVGELDTLGLDKNDGRLRYIRALLSHDVDTLEQLCIVEKGMYTDAGYDDLIITKWLVQVDVYPGTDAPRVNFGFRTYRSSIDAFPEGRWNSFYVEDGIFGVNLYPTAREVYEGAAGELNWLLNNVYFEEIPENNDMDEACRWCLTEIICVKLTEKHNKLFHTSAEISDYAEKVFGIADFIPAETHLSYGESHLNTTREDMDPAYYNIDEMKEGDVYASVPHGGIYHGFRITEMEQTENSAAISVQFYADASQTVRSHLYLYRMEKVDGDWTYTGCTRIRESRYRPLCQGV